MGHCEGRCVQVLTEVSMDRRFGVLEFSESFFSSFAQRDNEYFSSAITVLRYFHENRYSIRRHSLVLSILTGRSCSA